MPDISKCDNEKCPLNKQCWRFTAPDSSYMQSYADFEFKVNEKGEAECEYFWDNNEVLKDPNTKEIK